ncbi:hypothetical protein HYX14_05285 [Candidatus Woesearchaeota archaeon]|nr:hypothetical protein [Candidatus Woesearchaeota archaeon]
MLFTLEDWIRSFDGQRQDYGLEYLSAVTHGLVHVPYEHKYQAPDVDVPFLSKELKEAWEQGQQPQSIRSLDQLREDPLSPYHMNLLRHQGLSDEDAAVPGLAYLAASIIAGGSISVTGKAEITPSRKDIYDKLGSTVTKPQRSHCFVLRRPYMRVLELMGLSRGRLVHESYEALGLNFLERAVESADIKVVERFVEGILDHKLRINNHGTQEILLPRFTQERTAQQFLELFLAALRQGYPQAEYWSRHSIEYYRGRTYHGCRITIPKRQTLFELQPLREELVLPAMMG